MKTQLQGAIHKKPKAQEIKMKISYCKKLNTENYRNTKYFRRLARYQEYRLILKNKNMAYGFRLNRGWEKYQRWEGGGRRGIS